MANKIKNKISINLPKELKEKIEKRIKDTNFKSVQDYLLYILKEIASEKNNNTESWTRQTYTADEEADIKGPAIGETSTYSEEDEEALKRNLEDLGYI